MQCCRSWVRRHVSGDDPMNVLSGQSRKKRGVELGAQSFADKLRRAIDGGFDSGVICGFGTKASSAGITDNEAVFFGDQKSVSPSLVELLEPRNSLLNSPGGNIESDGGV